MWKIGALLQCVSNDDDNAEEDMDYDYEGFAFSQEDIICSLKYKPAIPGRFN